jgi:hypothetical protein
MNSAVRSRLYPPTGHVVIALAVNISFWAFMVFWPLDYLRHLAGGLEPFDLRPFGYSVEEARAFLFAISEIGRDYYMNVQLQLDTIYPATYALSRGLLLWWLTQPGRVADRPLPVAVRITLVILPLLTAALDYLENDGIAAMLRAGPQVDADIVATASFWTRTKSLVELVTEITTACLLLFVFGRWQHRRAAIEKPRR